MRGRCFQRKGAARSASERGEGWAFRSGARLVPFDNYAAGTQQSEVVERAYEDVKFDQPTSVDARR